MGFYLHTLAAQLRRPLKLSNLNHNYKIRVFPAAEIFLFHNDAVSEIPDLYYTVY